MTLWRTDNLSAAAGAPALHGQLTAFATSWEAIHIFGTDPDGDMMSLWWVPQFGGDWAVTKINAGGAALDPATITSSITNGTGLNIAGHRADTGQVAIYWWTPATQEWRTDTLWLPPPPSPAPSLVELVYTLTGPITTAAAAPPTPHSTTLTVLACRDDGHLVRWSWTPGASWTFIDLTELA